MDVSRRTILGTLALSAASFALAEPAVAVGARNGVATASPPGPQTLGITVLQSVLLRTFEPDWSRETTLAVPLVVELAGFASGSANLDVTVAFDPRLLDVVGDVILAANDAVWTARATPLVDASGRVSSLSFSVARPSERARSKPSTVVSLPLRPRPLYPVENLGVPTPFTIVARRPDTAQTRTYSWSAPTSTSTVAVWGAVVSAGWSATDGVNGTYRLPSALRVESVGPLPVPCGTLLTIDLDAAIVGSCSVTAALLESPPPPAPAESAAGGAGSQTVRQLLDVGGLGCVSTDDVGTLRTTVRLPQVPARSSLELTVSCAPTGTSVGRAVRFASVALVAAGGAQERLRDTGGYSTADVTASGNPQVDGVAVGVV